MPKFSPIRFICGAPFEEALASARGTASSMVPTFPGIAVYLQRRKSDLQLFYVAQCLTQPLVLSDGRMLHPLVLVESDAGRGMPCQRAGSHQAPVRISPTRATCVRAEPRQISWPPLGF